MAVSKRLRYEVLRRDNHTCRYCGVAAPDVKLVVDHVVPVSLGGTDDPANLVTACEPCNTGKSSASADAALVADVAQDALRWARARAEAADMMLGELARLQAYRQAFLEAWSLPGGTVMRLPDNWQNSIDSLYANGLPQDVMVDAALIAVDAGHIPIGRMFRYFCGCAWKRVQQMNGMVDGLLNVGGG